VVCTLWVLSVVALFAVSLFHETNFYFTTIAPLLTKTSVN